MHAASLSGQRVHDILCNTVLSFIETIVQFLMYKSTKKSIVVPNRVSLCQNEKFSQRLISSVLLMRSMEHKFRRQLSADGILFLSDATDGCYYIYV